MALKLDGNLFSGPFPIEHTAVRSNQAPVVYAIIAKGGQPWTPSFRVVDLGFSPDEGIQFSSHPRRAEWMTAAGEQIGVYLFSTPKSKYSLAARQHIAEELRARYNPPHGCVAA